MQGKISNDKKRRRNVEQNDPCCPSPTKNPDLQLFPQEVLKLVDLLQTPCS